MDFCLQIIKPHFHIKIDSFKFVFELTVNLCTVRVLHECRTSALQVLCENAANVQMVSLVEPNRAQLSLEDFWSALDSCALFDEKMALKNLQNREN